VVLRECRRILRGKGRICIVAMSTGRKNPAMRFYAWANKRFPHYLDCRPICAVRALQAAGFKIRAAQEVPLWGLTAQLVIGAE
jgi:ubiquinone/menaquinone biosynthesis C-methylase UbiE